MPNPVRVITEASSSGAQVIDGSLKFLQGLQNTAFGNYLKRTPAADGNRRIYTFSVWCTRRQLKGMDMGNGYSANTFDLAGSNDFRIEFESSRADALNIFDDTMNNNMDLTTNAVYRDVSAWYHVVAAVDTTQATAEDRVKLYVNGVQQTNEDGMLATATYPDQNAQGDWNDASYTHNLGQRGTGSFWDGNMSQYYFIDGQQLAASEFGFTDPLTNTWRPKKFIPPYKPNTGLSWSGMCAGGTDGGYGHEKAFDGADNTNCYPSPGSTVTMTIPAGKLKYTTSFKAWVSRDANGGNITVNGGSNVTPSGSGFQIVDLSGQVAAGADITEITWARASSGSIGIAMIYIMIDGVALLDTDSSNFGGQGFSLPFDGNTRIGEDQSGRGNDWTIINFPDTRTLDKATGGMPTLTTVSGGKVATMGIRTDTAQGNGPAGVSTGCLLALPLVGILTDVSYRINSSSTQKLPVASGAAGVTTEGNFYGGSYFFDGTNDEIVISSSDFSPGIGPFTIELWFNASSLPNTNNRLLTSGNNTSSGQKSHYQMMVKSNGGVEINWDTSAGHSVASDSGLVNLNTWHHFAMTRTAGSTPVMGAWLDGKLVASSTSNTTFDSNNTEGIVIGRESTGSNWWKGFISDVRYYNGVCKYTDNFLVGSPNPSIITESPSGAVYSSELTKVKDGAGAVSFEGGDDDYLSLNPGADFAFGTGDFTVELYLYYNGAPAQYDYIIDARNAGQTTGTWSLSHDYINSGGGLLMFSTDSSALLTASHNPLHDRWTHIAVSRNGSSLKMFYDGVEVASASDSTNFSTSPSTSYIGTRYSTEHSFVGFMSNIRVVKGTALYTANFTPPTSPLTNVTNTKLLCCNFADSATNTTVQPNAISATGSVSGTPFSPFDSNIDTVIGRPTNYCTLNPIANGGLILKDGNLNVGEGSGPHMRVNGTVGVTTGKWYYEVTNHSQPYDDSGQDTNSSAGIGDYLASTSSYPGSDANSYVYQYASDGNGTKKINNGSDSSWPSGFTAGTPKGATVMIAFDLDNSKIWFGRQGIWLDDGDPVGCKNSVYALTSGMRYTPTCRPRGTGGVNATLNFGQRPFKYPAPEGFSPLCDASIQTPEILRPDAHVGVTTYKGSGNGTTNTVSEFNFQPDLMVFKEYDNSTNWPWYDSVRGTSLAIRSNQIAVEAAFGDAVVTPFGNAVIAPQVKPGGFTISGSNTAGINGSGEDMLVFGWKAGGNKGTWNIDDVAYGSAAAAGLDGGSINPAGASVGTKEGFSILKYTGNDTSGATIAHGLSAAPNFVIIKNLTQTYASGGPWVVGSSGMQSGAWTHWLRLDDYVVEADNDGMFNDTAPSSSVVTFGGSWYTNESGQSLIMYCWHDVPGLQKFGKYTGNNSTNGPYVELGFRPAILLIKRTAGGNANWYIMNKATQQYNAVTKALEPNTADSQNTSVVNFDFLSNGFKVRGTDGDINASSTTYIYAAWAEEPFHNLYGGQSNAR